MPTVSAAGGCSPTARTRSPQRVRKRPKLIAKTSDEHQVHVDVVAEEQRPEERDVAQQRDLDHREAARVVQVLVLGRDLRATGSW